MTRQDSPPPYNEDNFSKPTDLVEPLTLSLVAKSVIQIYPCISDTPIEMYRLSWDILHNPTYSGKVTVERVNHSLRTTVNDSHQMRSRTQEIYTIQCYPSMPKTSSAVQAEYGIPKACILRINKNRGMGNFGLKKSSLRKKWSVLPLKLDKVTGNKLFDKDSTALFHMEARNSGLVWMNTDGKEIAETEVAADEHRLVIKETLMRELVDVLISMWVCQIWDVLSREAASKPSMSKCKFRVQRCELEANATQFYL